MKYFDPNMDSLQSRARYFYLYTHVPKEEFLKVDEEYKEMIEINIKQEMALMEAGWMT